MGQFNEGPETAGLTEIYSLAVHALDICLCVLVLFFIDYLSITNLASVLTNTVVTSYNALKERQLIPLMLYN